MYLVGLWKTIKNLGQNSRSPGRDLNLGSPEYEAGVLITQSRHLGHNSKTWPRPEMLMSGSQTTTSKL
jgi:hypothetical protein